MTDRIAAHTRLQSRLQSRLVAAWKVDFSLLSPGAPLAIGTLPGGGTYTQAAGAGQTEETWVTSWSAGALARVPFTANLPKIGVAPNGLVGLRLRQTWKNYVRNSEDFAWTVTGTAVVSANTTVSPDGTQNADTLTDNDGAGYELVTATIDPIPTDTERYQLELFVQDTTAETHALAINWSLTGGTPIARSERLNSNDGSATGTGPAQAPAFGSWWRWKGYIDGNASNTGASIGLYPAATTIPLPGADTAAGQGVKVVYGCSITRGKLPRDYQPTPAGSGATCADCAATYPASRLVRGGRLRLRFRWSPSGAPTDYNTNFRLVDHGAETTYVEFSATDQKLRVVVAGGAAEVCAVPMWWPSASLYSTSHPVVEVDLEIGGGVATRIRYRYSTDAGVTWTLPFDPLGGAAGVAQAAISASGNIGVLTGAAAGNVADGWLHEHEAILTAPAWALRALPTDIGSVRAWMKADRGYQLSAGLVSAWGDQTSFANNVTQGTAANQPAWVASGLDGRPYLSLDGSNDCLSFGADIDTTARDWLFAFVTQSTAAGGSTTLFDAYDGVHPRIILTQSGWATAGKTSWYDGAWNEPANETLSPVLHVWDLRAGASVAGYFRNGTLTGANGTYTQRAIRIASGGKLGAGFSGVSTFAGRIYEWVLLRSHSAADRDALHSYFRAEYPTLAVA